MGKGINPVRMNFCMKPELLYVIVELELELDSEEELTEELFEKYLLTQSGITDAHVPDTEGLFKSLKLKTYDESKARVAELFKEAHRMFKAMV